MKKNMKLISWSYRYLRKNWKNYQTSDSNKKAVGLDVLTNELFQALETVLTVMQCRKKLSLQFTFQKYFVEI